MEVYRHKYASKTYACYVIYITVTLKNLSGYVQKIKNFISSKVVVIRSKLLDQFRGSTF